MEKESAWIYCNRCGCGAIKCGKIGGLLLLLQGKIEKAKSFVFTNVIFYKNFHLTG